MMIDRPNGFYKYRSMDLASLQWVEKTVVEHQVYFAAASTFNDPFDLRPVISLEATPEQHLERYLVSSRKFEADLPEEERLVQAKAALAASMGLDQIADTAASIQAMHAEMITSQCGVFCVSARPDDILMWSHYGDYHRGICLEFDSAGPFMAHALEVHYCDDRPPLNPYVDDNDTMLRKAMLTKSRHWAYEAEWRLIDYQRGPNVATFRPRNLVGIIVGAMATSATVDLIRKWINQRDGDRLALHRARLSHSKFEVRIDRQS